MFPLADCWKGIASFREIVHMAITVAVVLLSIALQVCLVVAGFREKRMTENTNGLDEIELHLTRIFPQVTGRCVDICG